MKKKHQAIFTRESTNLVFRNFCLVIFAGTALKLEEEVVLPSFSILFQSTSILAISLQQTTETVSRPKYVLNYKTGSLVLEFNSCDKNSFQR